jgi:anti-anti-sigma factor
MLSPSGRAGSGGPSDLTIPMLRMEGTRTVVVVRGEVDLSTRPVLADVISRAIAGTVGDVVVDLGQATFVDSTVVHLLEAGQQLMERRGRKLTVRSPSRLVTRMLALSGLTELIEGPESAQL